MKISILFALLFLITAPSVKGKNIIVGKNEAIQTIKAAINHAAVGDTIFVSYGEYNEGNIIIQKQLVLIGENYPVLNGENKYEIFTIHADNVQIKGFFFKDTGVASIQDLAAIKVL